MWFACRFIKTRFQNQALIILKFIFSELLNSFPLDKIPYDKKKQGMSVKAI
jgi:hypothetical protein